MTMILVLGFGSCGEEPPPPAASLVLPPVMTAAPGQAGEEPPGSRLFESVSRDQVCTPPTNPPSICLQGRFMVTSDGTYLVEKTGTRGRISSQELTDLSTAANAVAALDLSASRACRPAVSIPEVDSMRLSLKPSGQPEVEVLSVTPGSGRCIRGDAARVGELLKQVNRLVQRYVSANSTA